MNDYDHPRYREYLRYAWKARNVYLSEPICFQAWLHEQEFVAGA